MTTPDPLDGRSSVYTNFRVGQPPSTTYRQYRGPARTSHGLGYWLIVGWWLGPLLWAGRVLGWLLFWPFGIWRSVRHSRKGAEARERRGYR